MYCARVTYGYFLGCPVVAALLTTRVSPRFIREQELLSRYERAIATAISLARRTGNRRIRKGRLPMGGEKL